ncbi:hypothetical protein QQP08_006603 [Theobroma cacao]|nr:hypothetical protein QQP08_006603 [Theobroma cacao]
MDMMLHDVDVVAVDAVSKLPVTVAVKCWLMPIVSCLAFLLVCYVAVAALPAGSCQFCRVFLHLTDDTGALVATYIVFGLFHPVTGNGRGVFVSDVSVR